MPLLPFPKDMYELRDGEKPLYGPYPDLKTGVDWFKSLIPAAEWIERRNAVATRFYQSLVGELQDPTGIGRFFDDRDKFGWYLFLGESFNEHPWNYEVVYGCRVVPVFGAIGRNLDLLKKIKGFENRCRRIIGPDKSQPNGGLFEILVAGAYARAGANVEFRSEEPGKKKTHDLDVELDGKRWAVECKRLETGQYVDDERSRMRDLWVNSSVFIAAAKKSAILNISFKNEMKDIPNDYLQKHAQNFVNANQASISWDDDYGTGIVSDIDVRPLQDALKNNLILFPGPVYIRHLTGSYKRNDSSLILHKIKHATNPHYIDKIDLAVVARWENTSDKSIEKRARDILTKLSEANSQLPKDVPGVIHIGFDALGDDIVEHLRFAKILTTARAFDRGDSMLEFIYCHYFAPEASPEETWAIDETIQWMGVKGAKDRPLKKMPVVIPPEDEGREGVHWIPPS